MVRTRGGSRLRPRVRFSTPEREEQAPVPAPAPAPVPKPVPEAVLEEPQRFRRYQTQMGPRAPSPVPQRRSRRARPSKRARTSGPGESSSSRPEPSPSAAEATSSPQLSPASRIRSQRENGKPHVVYYASKTLNETQRNYTTTDKELLAVVYALDKFRAYLVGFDIVIFTDHSTLKYLLTKKNA